MAIGSFSNVEFNSLSGIALGVGANVTFGGVNSVALGSGSIANEANVISVGNFNDPRRIVNLAAGVSGTDAVNVDQLNAAIASLGAGFSTVSLTPFSSECGGSGTVGRLVEQTGW